MALHQSASAAHRRSSSHHRPRGSGSRHYGQEEVSRNWDNSKIIRSSSNVSSSSGRRSKSTNTRLGPPVRTAKPQEQQHPPSKYHQRPRPISTGRILANEPQPQPQPHGKSRPTQSRSPYRRSEWDNQSPMEPRPMLNPNDSTGPFHSQNKGEAADMTRAIMGLREKREQAQSRRLARETLKQHPIHQQRTFLDTTSGRLADSNGNNPLSPRKKPNRPASQIPSQNRTDQPRVPVDPEETHIQSSERRLQTKQQLPSTPQRLHPEDSKTMEQLNATNGKISHMVRELDEVRFFHEIEVTASPQTPTTPKSPRRRDLSPRRISAMDRTDLELSIQTLVRDHDVLQDEAYQQKQVIRQLEAAARAHEEHTDRIRALGESLGAVQQDLEQSREDVRTGRGKLVGDYEEQLASVRKKLQLSSADIISLENQLHEKDQELSELKELMDKEQEEHLKNIDIEVRKSKDVQQSYEQDIAKLKVKINTQTKSTEETRTELQMAQQDLAEREMEFEMVQKERDEQQERISKLEVDVVQEKDRCENLQAHNQLKDAELSVIRDQMETLKKEKEEQVGSLQLQLSAVHEECDFKIQEAKRTQEEKEGRRLDELVGAQQEELEEYERRLLALQEQLTLSRERHQNDIQLKEQELETKLKQSQKLATEEYDRRLAKMEAELAIANKRYDEAIDERLRQEVELESKDRDVAREWERKDSFRQGELERLNDRLDRTVRALTEKEAKVKDLQERLTEVEVRSESRITEMEAQHAEELSARDEMLSTQRQRFKASESKIRTDLGQKEKEIVAMQELADSSKSELERDLLSARKALSEAKKLANEEEHQKQQLLEMQSALKASKKELVSECARHESIEAELKVETAKLEGKLQATESTLKQKRATIDQLQAKLSTLEDRSSTAGKKLQQTVDSLTRDLKSTEDLLAEKTADAEEKAATIDRLQKESTEQRTNLELLSKRVGEIEMLEEAVAAMEETKTAQERDLVQLKRQHKMILAKLADAESQLEASKNDNSEDLDRKERELSDVIKKHALEVEALEEKLQAQSNENADYVLQSEKVKKDLQLAVDQQEALKAEKNELTVRLGALEESLESKKAETEKYPKTLKDLEKHLTESEESLERTARELKKASMDKDDADAALKDLMEEISQRDEELDSLTAVLEKRDEELDHAKRIATKAIAQAEGYKAYYKDKNKREARQAELEQQVDELNADIKYLTAKNEQLVNHQVQLERDLHEQTRELGRRKEDVRDKSKKKSGRLDSFVNSKKKFANTDKDGFMPFGEDGFPVIREHHSEEEGLKKSLRSTDRYDDSMSTSTTKTGETTSWLHDFDGDSRSDFSGAVSEPGMKSRKSIERDALKRYVSRRYNKKNSNAV